MIESHEWNKGYYQRLMAKYVKIRMIGGLGTLYLYRSM